MTSGHSGEAESFLGSLSSNHSGGGRAARSTESDAPQLTTAQVCSLMEGMETEGPFDFNQSAPTAALIDNRLSSTSEPQQMKKHEKKVSNNMGKNIHEEEGLKLTPEGAKWRQENCAPTTAPSFEPDHS